MKVNIHQRHARLQKAIKLADVLVACGITPAIFAVMGEKDWELAAQAARVTVPHSPETRQLVKDRILAAAGGTR